MQIPLSTFNTIFNQYNLIKNQSLMSNSNLKIPKKLQSTYKSVISKYCALNSKNMKNNAFLLNQKQGKQDQFIVPLPSNANNNFLNQNICINQTNSCPYTNCFNQNQQLNKFGRKLRIPFTNEEDEKIKQLVQKYGTRQWQLISSFIPGRTSKQCRDRYSNYLIPGFTQGQWLPSEDELLTKLYIRFGPKWSNLQKYFPDRSTNSIKNRWNYFLCRQYKEKIEKDVEDDEKIQLNDEENDDYKLNLPDYFVINDDPAFLNPNNNEKIDDLSFDGKQESVNISDHVNEMLKNIGNDSFNLDDEWIII